MPDASPSYLELPVQTRAADVRPGSWDEAARTVEVIASTGAMVRRYGFMSEYDEEIPVTEQVFDLARFLTVGPVLDNHNSYGSALNAIGRVAAAQIENRQLLATLQFDTDPASDAIFQKIGRGILRAVSLGYDAEYERVRAKDREDGGTVDLYRATRVTPYEVSVVMMPADAGAVVRGQQTGATRRYAVRDATPPASAEPPQETPAQPEERAMPTPENAGGAAALPTAEQTREIKREAVAAYTKRLAATQTLLRNVGLNADDAPSMIERHETDADLNADILRLLAARDAAAQPTRSAVRVDSGTDQADKVFEAISAALEFRAFQCADPFKVETYAANARRRGLEPHVPKAPTDETVRRFARGRLLDIADTFLQSRGIRTGGMSIGQIAETALAYRSNGAMMTTADFPGLLANTANKLLSVGYSEVTSPWREIGLARRQDRPDFKTFTMYRRSGAPGLAKINEHGEIKRSGWGDGSSLTGQLSTAGVEVAFTRQMLINDDLGAFAQQNLGLGESAVRWEDDAVVTDLLYGNATLSDSVAFFDATRGNLSADVGAPDLASIVVAGRMFAAMTETIKSPSTNNGTTTRKIGHRLVGFLAALTEKLTIDQILEPRTPDAASNKLPAQLQGLRTWQEDRLQVEAAAPDVHFAISNRPALVYGGLEGDPSPRLSMQVATGTDGVIWQLVHDWYVAVEDPKAVIRIPKS